MTNYFKGLNLSVRQSWIIRPPFKAHQTFTPKLGGIFGYGFL